MCGIAGVIVEGALSTFHLTAEALSPCAQLQQHRGPDYFGQVVGDNYIFFHNRLSIVDISEHANQPVIDQQHVLVYNGEIYNYPTLYQQHIKANYPASDTLALFELLQQQHIAIVPELNGMFAFAWFDKTAQILHLARDRMGIKPLYYSLQQGIFYFSSEIKTLLCLINQTIGYKTTENLNSRCIDDLMTLGHAEHQNMPWQGINELKPGYTLQYDVKQHCLIQTPYFEITQVPNAAQVAILATTKEQTLINQLDELLNHSVKMHLLSDVPIGALCSGGIDSSLITAIGVQYNPNLAIYHAGIKGGGGEEQYAQRVAQHLNIDINYIYMDVEQYLFLLPEIIYYSEMPVYHPSDISLYAIADKAKRDGIKVLLCGEGADELFGGYSWHRYFARTCKKYAVSRKITQGLSILFNMLKLFKQADSFKAQEFVNFTAAYLSYGDDMLSYLGKRHALVRNSQAWDFFDQLLSAYQQANIDNPALSAYISNNLGGHLSSLLHRNDRMCMMASIEARVPFIENALIEFAMQLPSSLKVHGNQAKYLLKKVAERYIPRQNVYRAKAGFPVPWEAALMQINPMIFQDGFLCWYLNITPAALTRWFAEDKTLLGLALSIELWGRLHVFQQALSEVRNRMGYSNG